MSFNKSLKAKQQQEDNDFLRDEFKRCRGLRMIYTFYRLERHQEASVEWVIDAKQQFSRETPSLLRTVKDTEGSWNLREKGQRRDL